MTQDKLVNEYFEWMYQLVCTGVKLKNRTYKSLLRYLYSVDFTYTIPMDGNRAEDGVDLRYRFGYEHGYEDYVIASYLDNRPCCVLEMMVALAIRGEEHIMDDPDIGNRTGQWFWNMVNSLGLLSEDDSSFDRKYVEHVIEKFLNREYEPDGEGGLFTFNNCKYDLRSVEIWYQMMWYLDNILNI